ncbi:MAG: penicillin acylase family protein [bacterium]|nr:penicillin acylase family protein [bacterium]
MTARKRKVLLTIVLVPILILAGLVITFYSILHLSLPDLDGLTVLKGLDQSVEITYDKKGLPQIWAMTDHDGYMALGYLHASDRLFQMELIRHVAHGRLSEMLGSRTLDEDIRQRRAGHARMARSAMADLAPVDRMRLQSYVDGINTYFDKCDALPIEFYLLQLDFEPWTVPDCLTILSFQTWFSDALLNKDILFLKIAEKVGLVRARTILTSYPDWAPVSIDRSSYGFESERLEGPTKQTDCDPTDGTESQPNRPVEVSVFSSIRDRMASMIVDEQLTPLLGTHSSNVWTVSPSRSKSGSALFASDPHLEVSRLPGFWYFVGLHIDQSGTNSTGITTPGLPFVIMGHNDHAAYAFTAGGIDLTDLYHETINPEDSNQYLYRDQAFDFSHVIETLLVAGLDTPVVLDVRSTANGPVYYTEDSTGEIYSLHWAGFESDLSRAATAGFDLMLTANAESFREAVTSLGALNANWAYADKSGQIAYQLGSPLPIQGRADSRFPREGNRYRHDWRGYYPANLSPYIVDPARGWIGNCNNRADWGNSRYKYQGNFFVDRIMRLETLMAQQRLVGLEEMKSFQQDRVDSYLLRWRGYAVTLLVELEQIEWSARVGAWDGMTAVDSRETLLLQLFLHLFKEETFSDELGELHKQVRNIWLDRVFHEGDGSWFDNVETEEIVESADDIALVAMQRAVELAGADRWGDRHSLTVRHPLAAVPLLGTLLDLTYGPYAQPGTAGTLNASFFRITDDYNFETFVAPSWRMVIDFSDSSTAEFVLPAGNSGNPASPYFSNFIDDWRQGKYWTVPSDYERVKAEAVSSHILTSR